MPMRMFIFTILDCCLVEAVNFPARLYLGLSHQVGAANRLSQRSGRAAGGLSAQLLSRRGISLLPVPKTDSGQARLADQLQFFGKYASLANARTFAAYLAPLRNSKGVVYAKRPFGGPQEVLRYLARYTHRVAISNSRLVSVDKNGVAFKVEGLPHRRSRAIQADAARYPRCMCCRPRSRPGGAGTTAPKASGVKPTPAVARWPQSRAAATSSSPCGDR